MATREQLVETLNQLSPEDFSEFKSRVEAENVPSPATRRRLKAANTQDVVELMQKMLGGRNVEATRRVLMKMGRTDLVQRLSSLDTGAKEQRSMEEPLPTLTEKIAALESSTELVLETLDELGDGEDEYFKEVLDKMHQWNHDIYSTLHALTDLQDKVLVMVHSYGRRSVEKISVVFEKMRRTDLMQKLTDGSSAAPKKKQLDEHLSALIHKVATMTAFMELLGEMLTDLSKEESVKLHWHLRFTYYQKGLPQIQQKKLMKADVSDLVVLIVSTCGQQSVEVMMDVFTDMDRIDLVQRLSGSSSGPRERHSGDERWPALILKTEALAFDTQLLLETLADLSDEELQKIFRDILQAEIGGEKSYRSWRLLRLKDLQDGVFLMVHTYGQRSVDKMMTVLNEMNRPDVVQRLSDHRPAFQTLHSSDVQQSAFVQQVLTMAAVKHLLLQIVSNLSKEELEKFKKFLQSIVSQRNLSHLTRDLEKLTTAEMVAEMFNVLGQHMVEVTRQALVHVNRPDLVRMFPGTSSGLEETFSVDEEDALLERETEAKQLLSAILYDLKGNDLEKFKWLLQFTCFQKNLPQIPKSQLELADARRELVDLMWERLGQHGVEVTVEVFKDMKKSFVSEASAAVPVGVRSLSKMTSPTKILLETLKRLDRSQLQEFKFFLLETGLPTSLIDMRESREIVELMVKTYHERSVEFARNILKKIERSDLAQMLSDSISTSAGTSRSLHPESVKQDSGTWTKLDPEVGKTDGGQATIYRLRSGPGHFECSVSGLRWICQRKSSFRYQFCSWDEHIDRMESRQFMPAGPLMDVTVMAGKLNEAHLPHWICTEDNPNILDKFAVLHINDCGDVVEEVSEVTATHVKLKDPTFSPKAPLMKIGLRVKYRCNVLMYKTNTAFLTLHVYLIPSDPGLVEAMKQKQESRGYKVIEKSDPVKSLKMCDRFVLTEDLKLAKIYPKTGMKLEYPRGRPNFFEVYIENANIDFKLVLTPEKENQPVWECEVRKAEYQSNTQAAASSGGATGVSSFTHGGVDGVDAVVERRRCEGMPTRSIRQILKDSLKDLSEENFKEFKDTLLDPSKEPCIRRAMVEGKSRLEVADVMITTFTEKGALKVAKEILRDVRCNQVADELDRSSRSYYL